MLYARSTLFGFETRHLVMEGQIQDGEIDFEGVKQRRHLRQWLLREKPYFYCIYFPLASHDTVRRGPFVRFVQCHR